MFRKYCADRAGNFSILFAVTLTVLLMSIGVAIDVSGMTKHKANMQNLADIGALAASSSDFKKEKKIKKLVEKSVMANNPNGYDLTTDITFDDNHIQVKVSTEYKTFLMGMFGKKKVPVSAISEAPQKEEIPINIALVLDTTDSMEGAKLASMKTAVGKLITSFEAMENDLKVAIVPFSNYVNVGMENRNKKWMDVPEDSSELITHDCYMKQDKVCTGGYTSITETRDKDGNAYDYTYDKCNAYTNTGEPYNYCPSPYTKHTTWSGCVGSRDNGNHKSPRYDKKPFPGIMNQTCGEEVLSLTDNLNTVENKIAALTTNGRTYIPAGLMWGWRMLDSKQPFNDLSNKEVKRQRALVLMSDGKNTLSLNQPKHDGSDEAAANALTSEICELIKDENIQIYSVAYKFGGGDASAKSIISQCATKSDMFFDAQNQAELESAFEDIGRALFTVRLTR